MKSFFDLQSTLNEAIDQYSAQALGRKRNTMLRALTLDDTEFTRWVHDRIVRFSEQNGIPLQQLDVSAFKKGFNEWQTQLQNSDAGYGEVKDQVSQYISRFMAIAPGIIAQYQSGENAPVKEPLSPTMVPYEADQQGQGQQAAPQEEGGEEQEAPPEYATPAAPVSVEQIQSSQRDAMAMIDLIDNKVGNMGEQETATNKALFKEQIRNMADEIAMNNGVQRTELNYDMVDTYVSSARQQMESNVDNDMLGLDPDDLDLWEQLIKQQFAEDYGIIQPQEDHDERARLLAQQEMQKQAMDPKTIRNIYSEDAEAGLISAIERLTGESHLSSASKQRSDKRFNKVQKTYFDIQAAALFEKYPFMKGAQFKHLGRTKGQLTDNWKEYGSHVGVARTTKTDIVASLAEGNFVRYEDETGMFKRCSMREVEEGGCTNSITFSMKKGESQLMSGRDQETRATLETALSNLTQQGYTFDDPKALTQTYMNQGMDEESATQKAEGVTGAVGQIRDLIKTFVEGKTFKGQVGMYQAGGIYRDSADSDLKKTQEVIDSATPLLEQINAAFSSLTENIPELIGEMAYIAASGDGKFEPGSKEIATHFLSLSTTDTQAGPKIVPISRKTMYGLASNKAIKSVVRWKSNSVASLKKKQKPIYTKRAMDAGLEGDALDKSVRKRMDEELPYTFSTVLRMIMEELPDTQMEAIHFTISKMLNEQTGEEVFDNTQGVSSMTKKYTKDSFKWAMSNMDNMSKFFEMEPKVGDINLPDFGQDFGDTHFKKEMQDEPQDLDML